MIMFPCVFAFLKTSRCKLPIIVLLRRACKIRRRRISAEADTGFFAVKAILEIPDMRTARIDEQIQTVGVGEFYRTGRRF